ncbi:MAG: acyltransferase [Actinobacteria bacterium]|nr:acyltransferase [Actinomycetota bacterium]MBU1943420.1 acyltransferase [Actinomycetota bacterium]MBU2686777.1 acyltransferase [Actinomycetota bacterium]
MSFDKVNALAFAARNPRVLINAWDLRRRGVTLKGRAWIPGRVELALAGRASVELGDGVFIPRRIELMGNDDGRIVTGDGVTIDSGARLHVANRATLRVGDRVGIGPYNIFNAFDDLTIGHDTMFGPFVNVNCADHGMERGVPMREQYGCYGPVSIGADCWLGAMVVVTRGVTIGEGAVIGAGSVVCCDIPEYTIAAGSPARVIRERC